MKQCSAGALVFAASKKNSHFYVVHRFPPDALKILETTVNAFPDFLRAIGQEKHP